MPPSMISCSALRWLKSRPTASGRLLKQQALDGEAGAESHAAAAPTAPLHDVLQYEHDGGGRHIAEIPEHAARGLQKFFRQVGALAHGVQNCAAAGVNRPVPEFMHAV